MVDKVLKNTKGNCRRALADAGYRSERNFLGLKRRKIKGFVSIGPEGKTHAGKISKKLKHTLAMKRRLAGVMGKAIYRFGELKGRICGDSVLSSALEPGQLM